MPLSTPRLLSAAPATRHVVDCRGDVCVGPCLAAKKAVTSIAVGDTVKIITHFPGRTPDDLDKRGSCMAVLNATNLGIRT